MFDIAIPEFSQVRDPAPSESPSTKKDDAEEDESNIESLSINKDDEAKKGESNNEETNSRKARSDDSLENISNCPDR
jgi:protein tyrosine/serine phosphatase